MGLPKTNVAFRGVHLLALLILMQVFSPLLGCGGKEESAASSSEEPADPTDPDDAPPNVVNDIGFYMKIMNDDILTVTSKDGVFDTDCKIESTVTSNQDVKCRVDVQEGDLQFQDLAVNFNVPPNICRYMKMSVPYYYNFETGIGPKKVSMDIAQTGSIVYPVDCTVTEEDGSVTTGCTGHKEVDIDMVPSESTPKGRFKCKYDKTTTDALNCCVGDFELTVTDQSGAQKVTQESWGTMGLGCYSGPGVNSWSDKSASTGLPRAKIYFTADGVNETWTQLAPLTLKFQENYSVANSYGSNALNHSHDGFYALYPGSAYPGTARTSALPYAMAPIDDRDGSPIPDAQDSIKMECLDSSFEVIHQIQIYVREFNTFSEFMSLLDSDGVSGNPDIHGVEDGIDCDYFLPAQRCNDARDWDDILNGIDGNYGVFTDTYDTSPGNATNRGDWFPEEVPGT